MNKTDLSKFKKAMKLESPFVTFERVWSVYLQKENETMLIQRTIPFFQLEETEQKMLLDNFKKILTGSLNVKLFSLESDSEYYENTTMELLSNALDGNTEGFDPVLNEIAQKVIDTDLYQTDVVLQFAKVLYDTSELTRTFILCTVNKVERAKKQFVANIDQGDFDLQSDADRVINLKSPLDGFMFPTFEDDSANCDRILYYSSKANKTNVPFVSEVLNCKVIMTAKEEETCFKSLLTRVVSGKISPAKLLTFYETLKDRFENEEDAEYRTFGLNEIRSILEDSIEDIEFREDISVVYREIFGREEYQIKVDNILPDFDKKSINLDNGDLAVSITPKNLENVIQARDDSNQLFLLIKMNETISNDGLPVKTENVDHISFVNRNN